MIECYTLEPMLVPLPSALICHFSQQLNSASQLVIFKQNTMSKMTKVFGHLLHKISRMLMKQVTISWGSCKLQYRTHGVPRSRSYYQFSPINPTFHGPQDCKLVTTEFTTGLVQWWSMVTLNRFHGLGYSVYLPTVRGMLNHSFPQ